MQAYLPKNQGLFTEDLHLFVIDLDLDLLVWPFVFFFNNKYSKEERRRRRKKGEVVEVSLIIHK